MDLILEIADDLVLDKVWAKLWPALPRSVPSNSELLAAISSKSPPSSLVANLTSVLSLSISSENGFVSNLVNRTSVLQNALSAAKNGENVDWMALANASALPRENIVRQTLSLMVLTYIGICALYFIFAGLSYRFIFNKEMTKHPRFLKNQVRLEIESSTRAFLPLTIFTVPWFVAEVRGYSKLYHDISEYGIIYAIASVPFFLLFTDTLIYWIHRTEHHPSIYKYIHKPHHKWIVPTPYASHAFHPLDGYAQSLPYHIFPFLFPMHRMISISLFVFVNFWTILIHDSDMICNTPFENLINGPAHHTLHHLFFTCNYGQYFTTCDRLGGSYRAPCPEDDPLLDIQKLESKKAK